MFKLSELLSYDNIVIQCHNDPDADTIGSAFAVYSWLTDNCKNAKIVYSGLNVIKKSNIKFMVQWLKIPLTYVKSIEKAELLIYVDCQYGEGNVTKLDAGKIAVIDHHLQVTDKFNMGVVKSNLGSCATVIWELLRNEDYNFAAHTDVSTALYYGLFTDTNSLIEINHPLDKDMRDFLQPICDMAVINRLRNCNLTIDELEIAGVALIRNFNDVEKRYAIFKAENCDPNILGFVSDIALQVDTVDICLVYSMQKIGVKLSVRSCSREVMASEFVEFITRGVGSGGGHRDKAGGIVQENVLFDMGVSVDEYIKYKVTEYFDSYDVIESSDHNIDVANMKRYNKKPIPKGFVRSTDIFPEGTPVLVRTLEGDSNIKASSDIYLMIGVQGEVYPIDAEKFRSYYRLCEKPEERKLAYEPNVRNEITNETKELHSLMSYCISTGEAPIYAKPLERNTKVFTKWNPNGYMYGHEGDYLAVKCEDIHDVYIIQRNIFDETYDLIKENNT